MEKIKKTKFSTRLCDLYGKEDYKSHIEVGREYWWNFPYNTDVAKFTGQNWNKLKITYIRSGCVFYILSDFPDFDEHFFSLDCFLALTLEYAEINPIIDIKFDCDIERAKIRYCFDDERTIVKNWPNETEIEVDEEYMKQYPDFYFKEGINLELIK